MNKVAIAGAVGGGVLAVAAVVTAVVVGVGGGGASGLDDVAALCPEETLFVASLGDPSEVFLEVVERLPEDLRSEWAEDAPFDIFDLDAWDEHGVDLGSPVGVAMLDERAEAFLVSFGVSDEETFLAGLEEVAEEVGLDWEPEESEVGDQMVQILGDGKGPAFWFDGGRCIVVGGDRLRRYGDADDAEEGLEELLETVLDASEGGLAATEAFQAATDGLAGQASLYVNTEGIADKIDGDRSDDKAARAFLEEFIGVGVDLSWSATEIRTSMRTPLSEDSHFRAMFAEVERDTDVFDRVPGPSIAAAQWKVQPEAAIEMFEDYLRYDKGAKQGWKWAKGEIKGETGISVPGVLDNLSGEFGYVAGALPESKDPKDGSFLAFIGVKDIDDAASLLKKAYKLADELGVAEVKKKKVGDVRYYVAEGPLAEGFEPAMAVAEGRIWLSMSDKQLKSVLEGENGGLFDDERVAEVGGALLSGGVFGGFYDVRSIMQGIEAMGIEMDRPDEVLMWALAKAMDHVGMEAELDGEVLVATATATLDPEAVAEAKEALDELADGKGSGKSPFGQYKARAQTTEAIDNLDKMYKGAAFYYTTPRVSSEGSLVACQFPAEQECWPKGSPCDHPDNKYPADAEGWTAPTWAALNFQISAPHYFRYCFKSEGTRSSATFTATAHADLDCDGVWSTFERYGYGDESASHAECAMKGSSAFYKDKETE